jgi:FtsZ-binding cell division protein ZapB
MKRISLETELKELEKSVERARGSRSEIDLLNTKIKSLTETLQPITLEVEALRNKKDELTRETDALKIKRDELSNEAETLTNRISQLTQLKQSEESSLEYLRKERLQRGQEVKQAKKVATSRPETKPRAGSRRKPKEVEHTFIGKYEGQADWKAELAKLVAQYELTLDSGGYVSTPEKIMFKVRGAPDNVEKLASALNGMTGYVNLRAKLAATKKRLQEIVNAQNIHKEQLDSVNSMPWYKGSRGGLKSEKMRLAQVLAEDETKIRALTEDLKTIEGLLAEN